MRVSFQSYSPSIKPSLVASQYPYANSTNDSVSFGVRYTPTAMKARVKVLPALIEEARENEMEALAQANDSLMLKHDYPGNAEMYEERSRTFFKKRAEILATVKYLEEQLDSTKKYLDCRGIKY